MAELDDILFGGSATQGRPSLDDILGPPKFDAAEYVSRFDYTIPEVVQDPSRPAPIEIQPIKEERPRYQGPPRTLTEEFGEGLLKGIETLGMAARGVGAAVGEFFGQEEFTKQQLRQIESAQANLGRPEIAATINDVRNIRSIDDALHWAAGVTGGQIPILGSIVAAGAAGGAPAAIAAGMGLETGLIRADIGGDPSVKSALVATGHGIAAGALEAIPVMRVLGRLGTGHVAKKGILKNLGKQGLVSFIGDQTVWEGATEGAQTIIERAALKWVDENAKIFDEEGKGEIINATSAGMLLGLMGGFAGGGPIQGQVRPVAPKPIKVLPTTEQAVREITTEQPTPQGIIPAIETVPPAVQRGFKEPTLAETVTPQDHYSTLLGTKYLTKPWEIGLQDIDFEYGEVSKQIDETTALLDKSSKTPWSERRRYSKKGIPTTAQFKMAETLDANEEAPAGLTEDETTAFNYFRDLNRTLLTRTNEVRRDVGREEIPYRTNYIRHVANQTAQEIINGDVKLPKQLEYWMSKNVKSKTYNPMELPRELGSKLEELFSRDLIAVQKGMAWLALREIHLAKPLQHFKDEMAKVGDVMPKPTREWLVRQMKVHVEGKQTDTDIKINNLITETGFGKALNKILKPFGKQLSKKPMTNFGRLSGKATLLGAIWGRPKLIIRNKFQLLQNLALFTPKNNMKGAFYINEEGKQIVKDSRYIRGYVGIEGADKSSFGKMAKVGMDGFKWSAVSNANTAMKAAYWDIKELITEKKYAKLKGWHSSERTYTEPEGFLYPEEKAVLEEEMEHAAAATQYQYLGTTLPGIFRNKTLTPITRLTSWPMNYFFRFQREALTRMFTGRTSTGRELPWSRRLGWARYTIIGGSILGAAGYGASFGLAVAPHSLAPVANITWSLYRWVIAGDDKERKRWGKKLVRQLPVLFPGGLAIKDAADLMSGEKDISEVLFYKKKEE